MRDPDQGHLVRAWLACRDQLAGVVSRLLPPSEIEDIVQETYVRACRFRSDEEVRNPGALMVTIARNLALDHLKRADQRLVSRFEYDEEMGMPGVAGLADSTLNTVSSDEEFARFCEAVRQLPLQCRRVFVLKKVYGYSQREIAGALGLSESTVEKHVANGMKRCTRLLREHQGRNEKESASMATVGRKDRQK